MMLIKKMMRFVFVLFSIAFIGCSGGGDSRSTTATAPMPTLEVLPADYDFGIITDDNSVQPLVVTIRNSGRANLSVSDIALSGPDKDNFVLDLNDGANSCGSAAPTISAGSSCTVTVDFTPSAPGTISFSADLTIRSNDPTNPAYPLPLSGKFEEINKISVKINQIEACPRPSPPPATIYVSVIDQGGFPVTTLDRDAFEITEGISTPVIPTNAVRIDDPLTPVTLSVALLLDYSDSITKEPVNVTDMENAAISFVDQLGDGDEAEIIVYATEFMITQVFTSDTALLTAAIENPPEVGKYTALYDTVDTAVAEMADREKDRKAIIIITDGRDNDSSGNQLSNKNIEDVIDSANAQGVPVFTVGLGDTDDAILTQLANDTGGDFFKSANSANLATIYQQLANLLFFDQYILTYDSDIASTSTGPLKVKATYSTGITGEDEKDMPVCTP